VTLPTPPQPSGELPPPPTGYTLTGGTGSVPAAATPATAEVLELDADTVVDMACFEGKPSRAVRVMAAAPFGWWPAAVLAMVALVDRVEQTILAGALPAIKDEFGLTNAQAGLLGTGTAIAGAILLFVVARIASQVNRSRWLVWVLVSWSLLSLGSGLAQTFLILVLMRTLLGAAGAFNNPLAGSLLGDYFPRAGRSRAYGIDRLAFYLGNPIGVALGAVIAASFGWRAAFFAMVIPGLLVALLLLFLKEPLRGVSDRIDAIRAASDPVVRARLQSDEAAINKKDEFIRFKLFDRGIWNDFRTLLRIPTLRAVYLAQAALFFGLGGIFLFATEFFTSEYGVDLEGAGGIAAGVGGTGILIGFGIGLALGDRKQGIIRGWRILLGSIGLAIGAVATLVFGLGLPLVPTILAYAVLNIGFSLSIPSITAATSDLCGPNLRGQAFALTALVSSGASALGPLIIGLIADATGSIQTAFLFPVLPLVAAVFLGLRARRTYDHDADEALRQLAVSDA